MSNDVVVINFGMFLLCSNLDVIKMYGFLVGLGVFLNCVRLIFEFWIMNDCCGGKFVICIRMFLLFGFWKMICKC